jgi:fumarate reductase flavoprotein subunit
VSARVTEPTRASAPRLVRAGAMPAGTPEVPVAIVGAGACGLTAALMLRDEGIDCVLLERDATPQGSTALSSGFIPAAGTAVQRAAGVHGDSVERFAADIQAKAHGTAAAHLVQAYAEAIAPAIDALGARHGLAFELLDGFLYPGHSVRRMHTLPARTGAALVAALDAAAERAGAMLVPQALVRELWVDQAQAGEGAADPPVATAPLVGLARAPTRVLGVGYERPDGSIEHLACQVLVLACNGFGGNAQMVRELLPEMREAVFGGHAGNDGSAIAWGRALRAQLADLGGYQGHGSWAVPQGALITWALMAEGGVQVNARGERFHDESAGYSEASVQVLAQPGGRAWNVFDERLLALGRSFPDFVGAEAAGAVRHAADVPALAQVIGCDAQVLARTLAATRLQAPYCAVQVTGALFHTQGGLAIDAHMRVLHASGKPLPNLLAAGGAARGVSGNAVWGYLSGNGLLSAVAGGYLAAQTAASMLGCANAPAAASSPRAGWDEAHASLAGAPVAPTPAEGPR